MSKNDVLTVTGLEEVQKVLNQIAPNHARNLSRALIQGLASETAKEAKKRVPTDTKTLKKAIKAKRRRGKPNQPVSDVIIDKARGAGGEVFYWNMVEYGTGGKTPQPERPFLRPARDLIEVNMPRIIQEQFTKKLASAINRAKKKAAKK